MSLARKLCGASIAGALVGTLLALTVPPGALSASRSQTLGCRCDDDGSSVYKCTLAQDACVKGSEVCVVSCAEQ